MCSASFLPRFSIPRCLLKDPTQHVGDGWTCHVTCDAMDDRGNTVFLYTGRAQCVVTDEYKEERQFSRSSNHYPTSSKDLATIGNDFLDNLFSQPSEGIQLEGFEFDTSIQSFQAGDTFGNQFDGNTQSVVLTQVTQLDPNNNEYTSETAADVDNLANELLAQLPDDIVYEAFGEQQGQLQDNDYVTDSNALIEILSAEKQTTNERPMIYFLDENADYRGICIGQETYEAVNDDVEQYMDEPLESSSPSDCNLKKSRGRHVCSSCDDSFSSLNKLRSHLQKKHSNSPENNGDQDSFICKKCNRKFTCPERWQSHVQAHADPDLECPFCTKVLGSKASLKAHKKIHDRKFSCEYCARTYETEQQLKFHALKKHYNLNCNHCEFTCRNSIELDNHLKSHSCNNSSGDFDKNIFEADTSDYGEILEAGVEDEDVVVDDEDVIVDDDFLVVGEYDKRIHEELNNLPQGDDCLTPFYVDDNDPNTESFDIEQNIVKLDSAYSLVSEIMQIESINKHAKIKKKLTRDCHKCQKHFDRGSDFKRHAIEHVVQETLRFAERDNNGTPVFQCRLCEVGHFSRVDKLKAHLRNHLKLRLYQCNKCFKTFSDSSNYSKHKKVHGASVYQCDTCKRKFNTKKMITQHMDYHKNTKPLACQYCEKVCYFASTLKKHINVHHKIKGKGAFSCQNCHLKFPSMKQKWDHQWDEHGIRKKVNDCGHCQAKFRKYSELKRHLKERH